MEDSVNMGFFVFGENRLAMSRPRPRPPIPPMNAKRRNNPAYREIPMNRGVTDGAWVTPTNRDDCVPYGVV